MTLPDTIDLPVILAVGGVLAVLAVWLLFGRGRGDRPREVADVIAAVQAERDVLRANHAVEVADLEGRLAKALSRQNADASAGLKVKALEAELAAARGRIASAPAPEKLEEANRAREAALAREAEANASLSRLSYEHDGLRARLAAAERQENEARIEVDKREALLELRLQKIYELEAALREEDAKLAAGDEPLAALQDELAKIRSERDTLREEVATLKAAAEAAAEADAEDLGPRLEAADRQIAELRAELEVARTAGETPAIDPQDVEELRAAIRSLAEKFVAGEERVVVAEPKEPTLAERIRAFKAARDAEAMGPPRIEAPREKSGA